jgi:6-phospho-3-hexuloisomerase
MNYAALVTEVLAENRGVLEAVDPEQVELFIQEILNANAIHLYAMGRMQLSVRAFAMRLKHMGIDTYVVYDTTSPRIGPGDLLIGHCAVTNVELNVVRLAKAAGARIALLTAHPENEHGQLADLCVRIPGQIFGGSQEVKSMQPMASLLEQARRNAAYGKERRVGRVDAKEPYKPRRTPAFFRLIPNRTPVNPSRDRHAKDAGVQLKRPACQAHAGPAGAPALYFSDC